jgi:shikimate dehydrogenase
VTIPYKEKVMKYLDKIDEKAKKIGAVNTIKAYEGILKGYNTDYDGFNKSLAINDIEVGRKDVFVTGTGGAAKSVILCLLDNNARVHVFGRDSIRGRAIEEIFKYKYKSIIWRPLSSINQSLVEFRPYMLVNCTPVGMKGFKNLVYTNKESIVNNVKMIYDIVYNPPLTKLLEIGRDCGCKTVNGMDMLLLQALESIHIWTGYNIEFNNAKQLLQKEGFFSKM